MTSTESKPCDFNGCGAYATKHVEFNFRYGALYPAEDGPGLTNNRIWDETNLCEKHALEIKEANRDARFTSITGH